MAQEVFLVLAHGISDLQILVEDEGGRRYRALPGKKLARRFHAWLLENQQQAQIVPLPEDLKESSKNEIHFGEFSENAFTLQVGQQAIQAQPLRSEAGKLQLVLPKIQPTIDRWLDGDAKPKTIRRALVLSTNRRGHDQEPVATYTFIKHWLQDKGVTEIEEVFFLEEDETIESESSPIAPIVAERIEEAVRRLWQHATNATWLVVGAMGGIPVVKTFLDELAELLAGDRVIDLFRTEHGHAGPTKCNPIDAVRTRRNCLHLIRRGALIEAYGMAYPFHADKEAEPWVGPLKEVVQLLNSNPTDKKANLPALEEIFRVAERAQCLLTAIRVETALLSERWLDAINLSITFLDTAFHDAIRRWASSKLKEYDDRRRRMKFKAQPPRRLIAAKALEQWKGHDGGELDYRSNTVGEEAIEAWEQELKIESLSKLRKCIYKPNRHATGVIQPRPIDYRNYNTHGILKRDEIREAIRCFIDAKLWSRGTNQIDPSQRPSPGEYFLSGKMVGNVISDLVGREINPCELYQTLLNQIEAKLLNPHAALT